MEFFLLWILCAVVAAMIGSRKGRGGLGFFLGFFFGPFGILFALLIQGNRRECPACRSMIHKEATICPHCQTAIVQKDPAPSWLTSNRARDARILPQNRGANLPKDF